MPSFMRYRRPVHIRLIYGGRGALQARYFQCRYIHWVCEWARATTPRSKANVRELLVRTTIRVNGTSGPTKDGDAKDKKKYPWLQHDVE